MQKAVMVVAAVGLGGQAQRDQGAYVLVGFLRAATGPQRHGGTKAEAGQDDGTVEFVVEPIERGQNIADLGFAVVSALAEAGAPKVEAQDRKPESPLRVVQNFHGAVHHFVMHGSAVGRVGMADERRATQHPENRYSEAPRSGRPVLPTPHCAKWTPWSSAGGED